MTMAKKKISKSEKRKSAQKKTEDKLWKTPPRAYYNLVANAFGLQVFRTIAFKFKWLARRALLKKDVATDGIAAALKKDGVVVVNDFLEPDIYQRLREYYHDAITDQLRPTAVGPKVIAPTVCSPRANIEVPQEIRQAFVENTTLNDAIEINAAHRQNIRPLIRLHHYFA